MMDKSSSIIFKWLKFLVPASLGPVAFILMSKVLQLLALAIGISEEESWEVAGVTLAISVLFASILYIKEE